MLAHRAMDGRWPIGLGLHAVNAALMLIVVVGLVVDWAVAAILPRQPRLMAGLHRAYGRNARLAATLLRRRWNRISFTLADGERKEIHGHDTTSREEAFMRRMALAVFLTAAYSGRSCRHAQQIPATPADVAKPGGKIPGAQKLALVKVADGFNDPVGVTVANDGSGRIFVVERVGRVKVVGKDGKVLREPFLDLTKINPLGIDVQTGFVEQGLWSIAFHPKFKDNGYVYVHYASLPFNGASIIARYTVDPAEPERRSRPSRPTRRVKVIMNIPQPYYNHYGGMIAFGPDGKLYIGKGDAGWEGDPLDAGQRPERAVGQDAAHRRRYARRRRRTPIPKDNPFAKADRPQLMSLFGITEQGFSTDQDRRAARDLGLRPAQSLHVPLRPEVRRPVHRRCRPEPLGGDQLPAGFVEGRRELRLEAQPGHPSAIR